MRQPDQHRRNLWYAAGAMLLVFAIAQYDEHRRFEAAQQQHRELVSTRLAEFEELMRRNQQLLQSGQPAALMESGRFMLPSPPSPERLLILRLRRTFALSAFAFAAAMPLVWALADRECTWRSRRLIAEAMLALALFGTTAMMLGVGSWRNWSRFALHEDAAGYGLILIPLGIAAVLLARHLDRRVAAGHCPQCDYDLRGNVSGVCPECGTPVADLSSPAEPS